MPPAAATNLGYTPPDGGWGWAVVFGSFISIGFSYAFPKSLTIYFKEIQAYFSVSYSEIAWVSSVMLASMYAAGPLSSVLVNRYGSRPVVMVGGLMVCGGMVLASFGTTIIHLYLCVGVIGDADSIMPPAAATNLGYTPPDGGWGWAVVFGSFISIGFSYAFPKSLTIYFKEIQAYFSVSYSEIAWVSSVMLASMYAAGPLSSVLVNRYGSRPVVMVGGLMVCGGMVLASFGTTIIHLYLCVGVIGGLGLAFNLQPALTIIGTYFQAKRPLANGLAMAGSPVVLFTLAPLNQFLFDSFGWRGSFLILGAIVLNCCVAGALMRPVNKVIQPKPKIKPPQNDQENPSTNASAQSANLLTEENQRESKSERCLDKFIDVSLFKHRGFLIYLIGNVVMFFGFFAPVVFLAPYARHQGVDEYSAAFLLSIFALVDMFVRPATGLIGNTKWIRPRIQYFFSFAVAYNGVCHLLCPLAEGYAGLVVYTVFFGMAFGMLCALLFEVLMDLVGAKRFSTAVGLVTIIECGPVLLGPPMSGALVDKFGDYKYMYYACGVIMLVPGIFFFIMNYYNYKKLDEEQRLSVAAEMRNSEEAVELKITQGEKNSV